MSKIFNSVTLPTIAEADIVIIGSGSAGAVAAIAASQSRKYRVLIIERYGFPGGTSTQMLDTFYGFFTPGKTSKKIVGGIPDLVVNELDKTGDIFLRPNTYGAGTGVNYNPERLKQVWDQLFYTNGVDYLLHTTLVDVQKSETDENIIVVWNKQGFFKIKAKRIIDASGDADFCHLSNFDFELAGEKEPAQSMTTTFRMCNVNLDKYNDAGGNTMLKQKMSAAVNSGSHPLPRKDGSAHEMNAPGCISTVAVKVSDLSALQARELTAAEVEGRKQVFIYENFFRKEVPGYENSRIIGLSHQIGVRETRRVYGKSRLTKEDCMSGNIPGDSIFLCGAPIEDHRKSASGEDETYWEYIPGNGVYGVSYGTIVPALSQTTWMVGRCFSATHDAHASCRSMAQTMSMGQAAGFAAVISLDTDCSSGDVDIHKLRERLFEQGQVLSFPDKEADTGRNNWKNNF